MWCSPCSWTTGAGLFSSQGAQSLREVCPVLMCFGDLEKAFSCAPCGVLWEVLVLALGLHYQEFPVHVGLHQGCPLSQVLLIKSMDRHFRRGQEPEWIWFRMTWSSSLFLCSRCGGSFRPGPSARTSWRFAAKCEGAGMKTSILPRLGPWQDGCLPLGTVKTTVPLTTMTLFLFSSCKKCKPFVFAWFSDHVRLFNSEMLFFSEVLRSNVH